METTNLEDSSAYKLINSLSLLALDESVSDSDVEDYFNGILSVLVLSHDERLLAAETLEYLRPTLAYSIAERIYTG